MSTRLLAAGVIAAAFLGGTAGTTLLHSGAVPASAHASTTHAPPQIARAGALPDFVDIFERNGPAVVHISVTRKAERPSGAAPRGEGDPWFEFFQRFGVPVPQERQPTQGLGSGFIVSPDGIILTNAHVVGEDSEVTVRLTDRREFRARVIGMDRATDVAVIKIDARDLPTVTIGKASEVRVGEWVAAIGSPFGFDNTVTSGIVSAKWRSLPNGTYVPFIQTDVAVNPGNSGGPLFNMKGEVIGINSQIFSHTGGFQGLSFAIPIDVAVKVKDQLQRHGRVIRGHLGVTIQDLDQALAESFGLTRPEGALVASVQPGSPAEQAGVLPGDVIIGYEGRGLTTSSELPLAVGDTPPGTRATLRVWRNGKAQELRVVVGEAPQPQLAQRRR